MYLDYSRSSPYSINPIRWVRLLWSHQARLEMAHSATGAEAVGIVAAVALLAALLTTTHNWIDALLGLLVRTDGSFLSRARDLLRNSGAMLASFTLVAAPLYFAALASLLGLAASAGPRRMRLAYTFHQRFAALAAGSVPLLWFFLILQAEGLATLTGGAPLFHGAWNPMTNHVRFVMLMAGVVLFGVWIVDAARLYLSMTGGPAMSEQVPSAGN